MGHIDEDVLDNFLWNVWGKSMLIISGVVFVTGIVLTVFGLWLFGVI